ncbi:hypothetical protein SAMN05661086_02974 [Anaeromicropila populeti]|uniref:Uncharacterized protein n=1 Tax=Anaeromicropila populeti TaxID=37658 RepID=A0A1I6L125_9FIRM|nr:hypothetical protein SAMN05661086_02974 [Anaeromicropila populeti]
MEVFGSIFDLLISIQVDIFGNYFSLYDILIFLCIFTLVCMITLGLFLKRSDG